MTISNLPLTAVLCFIGGAMLLFGFGASFNALGVSIVLSDPLIRVVAFALSAMLIGTAIWLETSKRSGPATQAPPALNTQQLFSLDDGGMPSLADRLADAKKVSMLMRSGVSLFSQYEELFKSLITGGTEFRVVFCDPASPGARSIYGGSDDSLGQYLQTTKSNLARLSTGAGANRLGVRLVQYTPTVSLMRVEHARKDRDFIQVTLLFTHTQFGRDRPTFIVDRKSRWYDVFDEEMNAAWNGAAEWNVLSS